MASLIGALRVTLSADTAAFSTGMKRAERQATQSSSVIQKQLGQVKQAAIGFAAGFSLVKLVEVGKRALEYAGSLAEVAQQLGLTTRELQVFRFAGSQVGITTEEMDKAMAKLTANIGKAAAGSQQQAKFFSAMGINIRDASGHIKGAGVVTLELADKLAKVRDPAQRAAAEVTAYGKAGQRLDTLLSGGSKAINELAAAAEKMGLVLSDSQIQQADQLADKLSALKQVLEARIAGAVADNANAIYTLADAFSRVAAATIRFLASNPGKAATLLGTLAGAAVGGRVGAVVGGIIGAYEASEAKPEAIRARLHQNRYNLRSYYLQKGGTQAELDSNRLNPQVMARLRASRGYQDYRQAIIADTNALRDATAPPLAVPPPSAGAGTNIPKFLAPAGAKHNDHAEQRAKEAERVKYELDKEELDGKRQLIEAQRDLTTDVEDRNTLSIQALEIEHDARALDIQHNLRMVQLDKTVSAQEKAAAEQGVHRQLLLNDQLLDLKRRNVALEAELARENEYDQTEQTRFQVAKDRLQLESQLADTAAERREVELRILELAYRERKQALDRIQNDQFEGKFTHTEDERNRARIEAAGLRQNYGLQRASVLRDTAGPLEQFLRTLPDTAAKANEALQNIAAEGLQSLTDGLADAIMGAKSLGDVFKNVAKQIIANLIKIEIEKRIIGPLAKVLGSALGGGGGALDSLAAGTGYATGGFTGNISPTSVAGFVHGGEYVFDASAVRRLGVPALEAIRSGAGMPRMAAGNDNARGGITVNVQQSNNFAGGAATMDDVVRVAAVTKQATIAAVNETIRRGGRR